MPHPLPSGAVQDMINRITVSTRPQEVFRSVDLERPIPSPDPEFGSHQPGLLSGWLGGEPQAYLRLVANPFLGFTYLLVWVMVLYHSAFGGFAGPLTPILITVLLFGLGLIPTFMQFHCLDCGDTGRLFRWRKHVCHHALVRREAGIRRRVRGPTPTVQVVLWIWIMMALVLLLNSRNFFTK